MHTWCTAELHPQALEEGAVFCGKGFGRQPDYKGLRSPSQGGVLCLTPTDFIMKFIPGVQDLGRIQHTKKLIIICEGKETSYPPPHLHAPGLLKQDFSV